MGEWLGWMKKPPRWGIDFFGGIGLRGRGTECVRGRDKFKREGKGGGAVFGEKMRFLCGKI
jgi:hypothetical protein